MPPRRFDDFLEDSGNELHVALAIDVIGPDPVVEQLLNVCLEPDGDLIPPQEGMYFFSR